MLNLIWINVLALTASFAITTEILQISLLFFLTRLALRFFEPFVLS